MAARLAEQLKEGDIERGAPVPSFLPDVHGASLAYVTGLSYAGKLHVPRHVLFVNLKSTLQDSLEETSPVPSQLGQIISPEPVHLAQSASPIVDNS
jgi:hypothetical protein